MIRETKEFTEEEIPAAIQAMFDTVASHLLTLSAHYRRRYDSGEKVALGNGLFWLIRDSGNISLGFNIQPSAWNYDNINDDPKYGIEGSIKYSIVLAEHKMLEEKGVAFSPPIDY